MILPPLTADELRTNNLNMTTAMAEMLRATRDAFLQPSPTAFTRISRPENTLELKDRRLSYRVGMQLRESPWTLGAAEPLARLPAALEEIAGVAERLAGHVESTQREGIPFTEPALMEILLDHFQEIEHAVRRLAVDLDRALVAERNN